MGRRRWRALRRFRWSEPSLASRTSRESLFQRGGNEMIRSLRLVLPDCLRFLLRGCCMIGCFRHIVAGGVTGKTGAGVTPCRSCSRELTFRSARFLKASKVITAKSPGRVNLKLAGVCGGIPFLSRARLLRWWCQTTTKRESRRC